MVTMRDSKIQGTRVYGFGGGLGGLHFKALS